MSGGSSCDIYDGEQLARHGVIFVTANFRVGILGLLACSELSAENSSKVSGNYQLLDHIAILQWIRDNIQAFGGDPENVTIMGQSSGAVAVYTLAVSPMAKNLFRRVIAMGQDTLNMPRAFIDMNFNTTAIYVPLSEGERQGDEILQGRSIHDMRSMSPDELLKLPAIQHYYIDGHVCHAHSMKESGQASQMITTFL